MHDASTPDGPPTLSYEVPPRDRPPPAWPTTADRVIVFGIAAVLVLIGATGLSACLFAGPTDRAFGLATALLSLGLIGGGGLAFVIGLRR